MAKKVKKKVGVKKKPLLGAAKACHEARLELEKEVGDFEPQTSADPIDVEEITKLYELDALDQSILQMITKFPRMSMNHLAIMFGTQKQKIELRMKRPAFEHAARQVRATTAEIYMKAADEGARRLLKLVDHKDPNIALKAITIATNVFGTLRQVEAEKNKPNIVIRTTVNEGDGTLVQKVMEAELLPSSEEPKNS